MESKEYRDHNKKVLKQKRKTKKEQKKLLVTAAIRIKRFKDPSECPRKRRKTVGSTSGHFGSRSKQ